MSKLSDDELNDIFKLVKGYYNRQDHKPYINTMYEHIKKIIISFNLNEREYMKACIYVAKLLGL
jgi:hypothetical protein